MNRRGGFISIIIIIVLMVIILSLLGVSLGSLLNNKTLRENFVYLWQGVTWVWTHYITGYAQELWALVRTHLP